ncbi:phosphoenolpyruvate--protein phosphotransferase [Geomicrobium sp. JCM 19038]|uniref:phosphoenolpyruvate--protein phosphotransferase n=1 Tax=Geomicrobium sp. JCM 19038 TaxID=1460635 RepID=UPI00045F3ECC|nr:phosphoenolpyruvate--protein phosphotransferase [Geomicrobium sp. JCM 19038]GAK09746.1 phosphoenolpyruvate-protein phosphotransferase of PTS system [Geomicrobium sp. JCM 19038]
MSSVITGIAASNGIAIAKAFVYEEVSLEITENSTEGAEVEKANFERATKTSKQELEALKTKTEEQQGKENAEIFAAHLLVLEDPELVGAVHTKIDADNATAAHALNETAAMFISMFESMDNDYMRERAADIKDVSQRVLRHLLGVKSASLADLDQETIVIAKDLTPSDTAQLNKEFALGFATDIGGRTSHSAIMARSLEIPAVVGLTNVTTDVHDGDVLIVDGINGEVIVNPDEGTVEQYKEKRAAFLDEQEKRKRLINEPSVSKDGKTVELAANIGSVKDLDGVLNNGAEGVGLYRTEFLYMERDQLPTEEEQFDAYKAVVEKLDGKPVVIRTLDIGGDKELPYLDLPSELNPFLGFRAIRLCLENEALFRTQLRALVRASAYGNLKVMFPMVATLEEFRAAKAFIVEEQEKLRAEGISFDESMEVGIMVEIPSTAVIAKQFAKEVDFFSIGTNDLIQYTLAADRMSEKVSYLYQPYHPAILQLVKNVIDASHAEGKWTGMCGEMAGEKTAVPLLLGLGLDEFSMSASSVLQAREQLLGLDSKECEVLAAQALTCTTQEEVAALVNEAIR